MGRVDMLRLKHRSEITLKALLTTVNSKRTFDP